MLQSIKKTANGLVALFKDGTSQMASTVETGSNANGSYIKYSDGTLICYGSGTSPSSAVNIALNDFFRNSATAQDLPATFKDTSYKVIAIGDNGTVRVLPNSTTQISSSIVNKTSYTPTVGISFAYMAIGKWK